MSKDFLKNMEQAHAGFLAPRQEVARWQKEQMARFLEAGLPGPKTEAWKYTPLRPVLGKGKFRLPGTSADGVSALPDELFLGVEEAWRFVFLNGWFAHDLSSPGPYPFDFETLSGLKQKEHDWKPRAEDPEDVKEEPFILLNDAFLQDGAVISIPDKAEPERPLFLLNLNRHQGEALLVQPSHTVSVGKRCRVSLVLHAAALSTGKTGELNNSNFRLDIGDGSTVNLFVIHEQENEDVYLDHARVTLGRNSKLYAWHITLGGRLVRNNLSVHILGEGAEVRLYGLYLLRGEQHVDNRTFMDHAVPDAWSNELYKGIMDGNSTGVFNGKILVRKDAQRTNAFQHNPNILLSNGATINTKPQLEIFADDVKCSHGATSGGLDPNALFYLRTRGLGRQDAKNLLTYAFAWDVLDNIPLEGIKSHFSHILEKRFIVN